MPLYQNEAKCSFFDMELFFHFHANKTSFSQERLCTWPHFESEGFWNSEVAYWIVLKNPGIMALFKRKSIILAIFSTSKPRLLFLGPSLSETGLFTLLSSDTIEH